MAKKNPVSLEAKVFSVYVTTHMGFQGCFLSTGWKWQREDPPYHTLLWTLFLVTSLLGPLSPFRHRGKVRSGGEQVSGARPQGSLSDRGY